MGHEFQLDNRIHNTYNDLLTEEDSRKKVKKKGQDRHTHRN